MSTLEIVIALGIFTISITAVVMAVFGNQSAVVDTEMHAAALTLARQSLESARALARSNWDSVVSSSTAATPFTESVKVSDADDFLKSIVSQITWQSAGQVYAVELSTLVGDVENAALQDACAATARGDWFHPAITSTIDLGTGGPATGVDVKNGVAYVTADGNGALPDFFAVDVATSSPHVVWSINTGPGLMQVRVAGQYAYVANTSINGQLQVINLATHAVQNFKLPGSGSGDTANALYYYNHRVYLGTPKSAMKEFHIIDVSDPSYLHEVGAWEFNVGINALYVNNGVAYVATPDAEELKMLDVHDPAHPVLLGGYDAAGGSGNGKSLGRAGTRLYLGRTKGNDELYSLDINDVYNGAVARGNVNSSVAGIGVMGRFIFLATNDVNKEFQIWQTTADASKLAYVSSIDLPASNTSIDCDNQAVYLTTADSHHGLFILNAP